MISLRRADYLKKEILSDGAVRFIYEPSEIKNLSEEEQKQFEEDALLDWSPPGTIPNWSKHYKPQKKADK